MNEIFAILSCLNRASGANSPFAWDIVHILPKSKNGKEGLNNQQIVNKVTNDEKGEITTFIIKKVTYQVKKVNNANEEEWANYDYSEKNIVYVLRIMSIVKTKKL